MQFIVYQLPVIPFSAFSVTSRNKLRLKQKSLKLYTILCSIMAEDRSEHKCAPKVFFGLSTRKNRYTFTSIRQFPFDSSSQLTALG